MNDGKSIEHFFECFSVTDSAFLVGCCCRSSGSALLYVLALGAFRVTLIIVFVLSTHIVRFFVTCMKYNDLPSFISCNSSLSSTTSSHIHPPRPRPPRPQLRPLCPEKDVQALRWKPPRPDGALVTMAEMRADLKKIAWRLRTHFRDVGRRGEDRKKFIGKRR